MNNHSIRKTGRTKKKVANWTIVSGLRNLTSSALRKIRQALWRRAMSRATSRMACLRLLQHVCGNLSSNRGRRTGGGLGSRIVRPKERSILWGSIASPKTVRSIQALPSRTTLLPAALTLFLWQAAFFRRAHSF